MIIYKEKLSLFRGYCRYLRCPFYFIEDKKIDTESIFLILKIEYDIFIL